MLVVPHEGPVPSGHGRRRMAQNVTIDDKQIQVAIVVIVDEAGAKTNLVEASSREPGSLGGERKHAVAAVAVQGVHLFFVIGHKQAEIATAVVVASTDAHAAVRSTIVVSGHAALHCLFLEMNLT